MCYPAEAPLDCPDKPKVIAKGLKAKDGSKRKGQRTLVRKAGLEDQMGRKSRVAESFWELGKEKEFILSRASKGISLTGTLIITTRPT